MKFRCHSCGKDVVEELLDERTMEDLWYCKPCYEALLSETDSKIIEDMEDIED
ncbi:MAG: hypothetical protein KAW47_06095 [Thermoplasmatales archaeon]|nr:hypothetical protein [Thermoplasmatales archaeon]